MGSVSLGAVFLFCNLEFKREIQKERKLLSVENSNLPVYLSSQIKTPCLFGIFKPSVYVTYEIIEDKTALKHAVCHEITHYEQGDNIWSCLRCLCLILHWYNPLVWYAAILSKQDAELACDERTVKKLGEDERAAYGRTLVTLTCQKRCSMLISSATMGESKAGIKERIVFIVKKPSNRILAVLMVVFTLLFAVGCTFTGAEKKEESQSEDVIISLMKTGQTGIKNKSAYPDVAFSDMSDDIIMACSIYKDMDAGQISELILEEIKEPKYDRRVLSVLVDEQYKNVKASHKKEGRAEAMRLLESLRQKLSVNMKQ